MVKQELNKGEVRRCLALTLSLATFRDDVSDQMTYSCKVLLPKELRVTRHAWLSRFRQCLEWFLG